MANAPLALNHFSVDCTVFGFDGERLCVLLLRRSGEDEGKAFHDMKLPGSLIYQDEDLDSAAKRVLQELTGLKNLPLRQFKAFGSKDRTSDPKDVRWLERAQNERVERIVTVAYIALIKIDRALVKRMDAYEACWVPIDYVPTLAFDHNAIITEALRYVRMTAAVDTAWFFSLLPRKFTAPQLRRLFEVTSGKKIDATNFYKKLKLMPYIVPVGENEKDVPHRAARYFRFDRTAYRKHNVFE